MNGSGGLVNDTRRKEEPNVRGERGMNMQGRRGAQVKNKSSSNRNRERPGRRGLNVRGERIWCYGNTMTIQTASTRIMVPPPVRMTGTILTQPHRMNGEATLDNLGC